MPATIIIRIDNEQNARELMAAGAKDIAKETAKLTAEVLRMLKEKPLTKQEVKWIREGFNAEVAK